MAEELQSFDSFGQNNYLKFAPIILFFAGLFVLAVGFGLFIFKNSANDSEIQIIEGGQSAESEIVIHVDGAVAKPGVYKLKTDGRVADAVTLAGGLTNEADQSRINLAAKLTDGQKLYIVKTTDAQSSINSAGVVGGAVDSAININSSSQKDLEKLPGIGPVTAQKIIALRPYSSVEELLSKKAVGKSVYEKIKDSVVVY